MNKIQRTIDFVIGAVIGASLLSIMMDSRLQVSSKAITAINECQVSLPRDMTCELTARVLK